MILKGCKEPSRSCSRYSFFILRYVWNLYFIDRSWEVYLLEGHIIAIWLGWENVFQNLQVSGWTLATWTLNSSFCFDGLVLKFPRGLNVSRSSYEFPCVCWREVVLLVYEFTEGWLRFLSTTARSSLELSGGLFAFCIIGHWKSISPFLLLYINNTLNVSQSLRLGSLLLG